MNFSRLAFTAFAVSVFTFSLSAAELRGVVTDPSGAPVPGAQVAAVNPLGIVAGQVTDDQGRFDLYVSPMIENVQLRVAAMGFQTVTVPEGASSIQLKLAPVAESLSVVGSSMAVPASQQGSSVSVITSEDLRERNEAQAVDLLHQLPGITVSQNGGPGSVASIFVRGGESKYNLVLLNGIPVNSFYYGGLFDFAHIPSDAITEIGVARGPQSATYGSYALGSVFSIATRSPDDGPALDILSEGGTHLENRDSISGAGSIGGKWGIAGSVSAYTTNGPVPNSDYQNNNGLLSLQGRWRAQSLYLFGDFDSNDVGEPGAFGSNPKGYFTGIDRKSRSHNNTSTAGLHYENDLSDKLRADVFAGLSLNNSTYSSTYSSFNKDLRAYGEGRMTWNVRINWTMTGGYSFAREEMRNTYITDTAGDQFLLRRDEQGVYWENRLTFGNLSVNAGLRGEVYQTPLIPGDTYGYPARPDYPARTDSQASPKISGTYRIDSVTRAHASYGTGLRPPGGSDLAFTNNPALKPERTMSYDAGIERRFWNDKVSLDATWFHNRFSDLIVSLGGSLATLSHYYTDNVSNAKTEGIETTVRVRPSSTLSVTGNYTWLETAVLALDGSNGLVQTYYYLGQPLLRRPKQSGSLVVTRHWKRLDGNVIGEFRGKSLDVEPNYGAFGGKYWNPGWVNFGLNLNYRVRGNLSVYANAKNILNRHYEEIYGYPAPLFSLTMGVKWTLARAR